MKVPSYNDLELTFIIVKPYVNLKSHKKDSQYGDSATSKNRLLHISFHTTYAFFNNLEFIYTWICNILLLALYPFRKYPNIFPQRFRPVYFGFLFVVSKWLQNIFNMIKYLSLLILPRYQTESGHHFWQSPC